MNPLLAAESIRSSMPEGVIACGLQAHAPLRQVGDDWTSPLSWSPGWFRPYVHQATAFERLSTSNSFARPTLLVAGRSAGKTEAYLYPILDHCLRQHRNSRPGMKALVICPTAGTAREHARRAATVIGWDPALEGIRIGCHPGAAGRGAAPMAVGSVSVAVDPAELGAAPPDVVFSTAAALGSLMVDPGFEGLWSKTTRESLRYVVVEDVDGYGDGELGELALGLRRVGAKLHAQSAAGGPPLGGTAVMATISASALEVDQMDRAADLGSRLFGVEMGLDSIVVESRHTAAELTSAVDPTARVPAPAELAALAADDIAGISAALGLADVAGDPVALGSRLGLHPLTSALMAAASERPVDIDAVADMVGQWAPAWQTPPGVRSLTMAALGRLISVLAAARHRVGALERPLVTIDVHVWLATAGGESRTDALVKLLPSLWGSAQFAGPERRTLVVADSLQEASHGAALVRRTVSPEAAGPGAPAVIARDVTQVTLPGTRAAVEGAFDAAHPEAPLVLLTSSGADVDVDQGALATMVLLGAPADAAAYRRRVGNLGRDLGSSVTVTVVGDGGRDRAVASDVGSVVAGPLRLPTCLVDDAALLHRYYLAEAADRVLSSGRRGLSGSVPAEQIVREGFDPEAVLGALVGAASDPDRVASFVGSLGIGGLGGPVGSPAEAAATGQPGTLFGRPVAADGGAGSIVPPTPDPSSAPPLPSGSSSGLPLLETGVARSVALIDSSELLDAVRSFAEAGVVPALEQAVGRWRDGLTVLRDRQRRTAVLTRAAVAGHPRVSPEVLAQQAPAVFDTVRSRRLQPWPDALVQLGVLADPAQGAGTHGGTAAGGVELDVALWPAADGQPQVRFKHRFPRDSRAASTPGVNALVPGSTVFAEAHRVTIDGIDLTGSPITGSDSDRRVLVDHLVAEGPEVPARDDGSAVVQPEPETVSIIAAGAGPAWALPAVPFGAQLLRDATVAASYGERTVCSHCGVVQGVRPVDAADPLAVHRLWCAARTDPSAQSWASVELVSETRASTALRILLPVGRFDADRRTSAFEAAILAGIDRSGRGVGSIAATRVRSIESSGGQRHSLVLSSDSDAGREGLEWLVEPSHLREVVESGWRSGAAATVGPILEQVVRSGGEPTKVDSLDDVSLDQVDQRDMADAVVDTLARWAQLDEHAERLPGEGGAAFGLVLSLEGTRHAYQIGRTSTGAGPGVSIRTAGHELPPVVVVAAGPMADVPAPDSLVWGLCWSDLDEFRAALLTGAALDLSGVVLFTDVERAEAGERQHAAGGVFAVAALEQNPLALLLDVLARPSVGEWRRLAQASGLLGPDAAQGQAGDARQRSARSNIRRLASL